MNIKQVVALATSLQRITKTTLAWTFGAALHQPHHPSPQRKFTQWAMINAQQSESVQLLPRPCDSMCTLCGCPKPSWPMTHLIPETTCESKRPTILCIDCGRSGFNSTPRTALVYHWLEGCGWRISKLALLPVFSLKCDSNLPQIFLDKIWGKFEWKHR